MAKRIHHKIAHRDVDFFDKSKGKHYVPLCIQYAPYKAKKPILELRWENVTCKYCHEGRWNKVPDGMGLRLVKPTETE